MLKMLKRDALSSWNLLICFLKLFLPKKKKKDRISPFPHNSGFDKLAFLDEACSSKTSCSVLFKYTKNVSSEIMWWSIFNWFSNHEILNMATEALLTPRKQSWSNCFLDLWGDITQRKYLCCKQNNFHVIISLRGVQNIQLLLQVKQGKIVF